MGGVMNFYCSGVGVCSVSVTNQWAHFSLTDSRGAILMELAPADSPKEELFVIGDVAVVIDDLGVDNRDDNDDSPE